MTSPINTLNQADRIDLIRYITKQRSGSGELYAPSVEHISILTLNELAVDVVTRSGHPSDHILVQADDSSDGVRVTTHHNEPTTITINEAIIKSSPYLALYLTTQGAIVALLRRYGPHRYSNDQEMIIAAHASVLLGYGVLGINAYHEPKPKNVDPKQLTTVTMNQYSHWLIDYIQRHQLQRGIMAHLLPAAQKTLPIPRYSSQTSDPLINARLKAHAEKQHKQIILASASFLTILLIITAWSITPKPLTDAQLTQLRRIEEARQAYDVCHDELRAMNNINQRDILSSRSLQAKHRSCESLRLQHNQLVQDFQLD